jgi:hypothetical protein
VANRRLDPAISDAVLRYERMPLAVDRDTKSSPSSSLAEHLRGTYRY